MQVNIFEAKNRLSELIKSARAGEEVVIANRGEPVARLVPADGISQERGGTGDGRAILQWLERHPLPSYAARSVEELDASIDEARSAWD
ncbi:MAG TPA: type II toxin-antitoxin system prevent-host-death family antitoxin [Alphaproteobacteria bacterium]|jgi:prevent-host-death family protein|nr:type II toxin-antitoxin system prevent-host-death family antitoxin [Alphaproteobacteria bacterium]